MNTVYLSQAEPLLRGAHAATINQGDRDALRLIHCAMLRFMRGQGIFMAEIPADKASKTRAPGGDPLTPDPACPHCHGTGVGIGSVFDRCICTYGSQSEAKPERRVVMDEDDARKADEANQRATLEHNIACMVSDYEQGNIAGGRLRWAALKADLRGQS